MLITPVPEQSLVLGKKFQFQFIDLNNIITLVRFTLYANYNISEKSSSSRRKKKGF